MEGFIQSLGINPDDVDEAYNAIAYEATKLQNKTFNSGILIAVGFLVVFVIVIIWIVWAVACDDGINIWVPIITTIGCVAIFGGTYYWWTTTRPDMSKIQTLSVNSYLDKFVPSDIEARLKQELDKVAPGIMKAVGDADNILTNVLDVAQLAELNKEQIARLSPHLQAMVKDIKMRAMQDIMHGVDEAATALAKAEATT